MFSATYSLSFPTKSSCMQSPARDLTFCSARARVAWLILAHAASRVTLHGYLESTSTKPQMETSRVDQPIGSKFFDRPVKPVETLVKFSFLATKRHLSTNRNIHIYFIINKTFYKTSINKPHLLKTLVEWFQAVTNML